MLVIVLLFGGWSAQEGDSPKSTRDKTFMKSVSVRKPGSLTCKGSRESPLKKTEAKGAHMAQPKMDNFSGNDLRRRGLEGIWNFFLDQHLTSLEAEVGEKVTRHFSSSPI